MPDALSQKREERSIQIPTHRETLALPTMYKELLKIN